MRWVDLRFCWEQLAAAAAARDAQKRGYASSRYWNQDSHFHGLLGEAVVGKLIGASPRLNLVAEGDGGSDFPFTDVKTATFLRDPHLKHPVGATHWPEFFVLVALDVDHQRGVLAGYATKAMLLHGGSVRNYGHQDNHVLTSKQIVRGELPSHLTHGSRVDPVYAVA